MLSNENNTNEQKIVDEIRGLDQNGMVKILRMIHFMKREFLTTEKNRNNPNIIKYAGMLKDLTDEESELFTNAIQRQNMFGGRKVKL